MLLSINQESVEDARRILTVLCYAMRPLTTKELIEAVAVELGDEPRFNSDGRLDSADDIRRVCPGLIDVDVKPEYGALGPSAETLRVRIAHFSVQEYLESERICQHRAAAFSVGLLDAHTEIANVCLTYLLEPALILSDNPREEYPMVDYAANYWPDHIRCGHQRAQHITPQILQLLESTGSQLENWVRISNFRTLDGAPLGVIPSPLYYISILGLDLILEELLRGRSPAKATLGSGISGSSSLANSQREWSEEALLAASYMGHVEVVRLLIDWGVDVNANRYGTALHTASGVGEEETVRLLLARGADVNGLGLDRDYALQAAVAGGHEEVVRLLLEHGANVNARGGRNSATAVMAAASRTTSATRIRRLLLEWGATEDLDELDSVMIADPLRPEWDFMLE